MVAQKKKAIITWLIVIVGGGFTCGLLSLFLWVAVYDGYLIAQKLQSGQAVGENENGLDFLNAIFKD